jgi:6-phosphogluconolactonase
MTRENVEIYPELQAIGDRLAEFLKQAENKRISFVLSGGNTPRKIFSHLGKYHSSLAWQNIDFFWGDERCVPPDHPESNYRMARKSLFELIHPSSSRVHRIHGEDPPHDEKYRYQEEIRDHVEPHNRIPVFDIMMLGIGEDGHTASIFPDQLHLLQSKNICEVAVHPQTGQKRITLTGPLIKMSRNILFIATGINKAEIVSRILKSGKGCEDLPAYQIRPENGELFWILDQEASSNL